MTTAHCSPPYIATSIAGVCGQYLFMSLLDQYIRNHTDISGFCDRITPRTTPDHTYDFIVIGGGSGGATAAGRLAQYQRGTVLLIEAGNDEPPGTQVPSMFPLFLQVPEIDWHYRSEPQLNACLSDSNHRCNVLRAKVLGGCSVINGMMYIRGLPQDFQRWTEAGNYAWGHEENFQFFRNLEGNLEVGTVADAGYHGTQGPLTISRFPYYPSFANDLLSAAQNLNYNITQDINGVQTSGFAIAQTTNRNGTRLSAAKAFLWPQRNNSYLHVMLNTTAYQILFDHKTRKSNKHKKRAIGVRISYNGKSYFVRAKREIILSAGTFNSPKLLMLSGIGKKDHLKSLGVPLLINLSGVGENFHNHVSFTMTYALTKINNTNDLDNSAIEQYFKDHSGPMSSTGLSQVTARLNSKYALADGTWPDLQFFFNGFSASCGTTGNKIDSPSDSEYKTIDMIPVVLHPKSRGRILLKSKAPEDPPLIQSNDLSHPDDVATLVDGIRIVQNLSRTDILVKKYGIRLVKTDYGGCDKKHVYDSDEFWGCAVQYATSPENHQVGTCKMGLRNDSLAVVDQKLLVHGTKNLRVMDASVIPVVVSGNTAATIMMVAERGVHFILEDNYGSH